MSELIAATYKAVIDARRPNARSLELLGAGDINDVVLVDGTETFRFPKTEEGRDMLGYEIAVLHKLAGKITLSIPAVQEAAFDNSYAALSYVAGTVLSNRQIAALTASQKTAFADALAAFMCEVNGALSLSETTRMRQELMPHFRENEAYYDAVLERTQRDNRPFAKLYEEYYCRTKDYFGGSLPVEFFVMHGDLHAGNMLFDGDNTLRGIIDFGDCGPTTIYEELRQFYKLGEDIMRHVVYALNGRFGAVDIEGVRLHTVLHELAVLMRPESQPPKRSKRANGAILLLNDILGSDWQENK